MTTNSDVKPTPATTESAPAAPKAPVSLKAPVTPAGHVAFTAAKAAEPVKTVATTPAPVTLPVVEKVPVVEAAAVPVKAVAPVVTVTPVKPVVAEPKALKAPKAKKAAPIKAAAKVVTAPKIEKAKIVKAKIVKAKIVKGRPVKAVKAIEAKAVAQPKAAAKTKTAVAKAVTRVTKKQPPAVATIKPAIDLLSQSVMEFPEMIEAQLKKLQNGLFSQSLDIGDVHIANAELHELVEEQRVTAIAAARKMSQEMEKFFEASIKESLAASNQLMRVKSLPELIEMQSKLTQSGFQACVEHSRQMGAIANSATLDVFRPLTNGWSETMTGWYKRAS
jgi:hypothetical protein